jgi:anthranilate synthase component 1
MFFSSLLAFDHVKHQIQIIANVFTDGDRDGEALRERYIAARAEIARLEAALLAPVELPASSRRAEPLEIRSNMTKECYSAAIERIKEYIRAGDAFQVVFAQRFATEISTHPFQIYRALRVVNPSPYMFFLKLGEEETLLGASPEMLVRSTGRNLEYRPIAGTYPRGATEAEDQALAVGLQADEKERAEHVMLVDLGRNDLGRVSRPGTVTVSKYMEVERYSHVLHLVSHVEGRLKSDLDALDALRSVFPAGTLSGAPKIRAMQLIAAAEGERRGLYGGAVGYLGYDGNLDTAITIRSAVLKDGQAHVHTGAGIVAGSVPEREFEETEHKAAALRRAIDLAAGVPDEPRVAAEEAVTAPGARP